MSLFIRIYARQRAVIKIFRIRGVLFQRSRLCKSCVTCRRGVAADRARAMVGRALARSWVLRVEPSTSWLWLVVGIDAFGIATGGGAMRAVDVVRVARAMQCPLRGIERGGSTSCGRKIYISRIPRDGRRGTKRVSEYKLLC